MKIKRNFKTTEEIEVPEKLIDQVIGQEKAKEIIRTAAKQKRHVLLIGEPGTGKSMLAQAMSELMEVTELYDILAYPNPIIENEPIIKAIKTYPDFDYLIKNPQFLKYYTPKELAIIKSEKDYVKRAKALQIGLGRRIIMENKHAPTKTNKPMINPIIPILLVGLAIPFLPLDDTTKWLLLALLLGGGFVYFIGKIANNIRMPIPEATTKPKLIVDNTGKYTAPFIDATGAKAGALLGDVKHDPLQSGGLGTPPHLRVEAGAIHKANKGVLFIDEIANLPIKWQAEILTAMQEKKYSITGQSELSSGSLVKTTPAPTDFVLVAAGNLPDLHKIHPALRSRIQGSGYEVFMETEMDDNPENRKKLIQFIAQEVKKDRKIPHFTRDAVKEIIKYAKKMSGRKDKLTLRLRELSGIIKSAGDIAIKEGAKYVEKHHVLKALKYAQTIEDQLVEKMIEKKKEYQIIKTTGYEVGRVNGLAVIGNSHKGIVLPIVAEVTPSTSAVEGKIIATGRLGEIAKEAVQNVSAIVKKYFGSDLVKKDIHIQFLQTYEGVEGDSASISVAVAVFSALLNVPVKQSVAMTGSLDVKGNLLPVGGVSAKIESAIEANIKTVIIPKSNINDVLEELKRKINIKPVSNIREVLEIALKEGKTKKEILKKLSHLS